MGDAGLRDPRRRRRQAVRRGLCRPDLHPFPGRPVRRDRSLPAGQPARRPRRRRSEPVRHRDRQLRRDEGGLQLHDDRAKRPDPVRRGQRPPRRDRRFHHGAARGSTANLRVRHARALRGHAYRLGAHLAHRHAHRHRDLRLDAASYRRRGGRDQGCRPPRWPQGQHRLDAAAAGGRDRRPAARRPRHRRARRQPPDHAERRCHLLAADRDGAGRGRRGAESEPLLQQPERQWNRRAGLDLPGSIDDPQVPAHEAAGRHRDRWRWTAIPP